MDCDVTYEELAALLSGDLGEARQAELRRHADGCPRCRDRLDALRRSDAALAGVPRVTPPGRVLLAARRALADVTRGASAPEVMTLAEVVAFLRLTPHQLGQVVDELPAFELAGQIRVRRERLVEWIQQRERDYTRSNAQSDVARSLAEMPHRE